MSLGEGDAKLQTGIAEGGVAGSAIAQGLLRIILLTSIPHAGAAPKDGVPDMTVISDIDEFGINTNLRVRYKREQIYVRKFSYPITYYINFPPFLQQ